MRMTHPNSMSTSEIESIRLMFVGRLGEVSVEECDGGVVYLRERDGRFYATGFSGKAVRPAFHYWFSTPQGRADHVSAWQRSLAVSLQSKRERAAERKADTHGLLKGSILYSSWGYEQTNIEWYEVIDVISDRMVVVRKIAARIEEGAGGSMSGRSYPVPGQYVGEPMRKRASSRGISLTSFSSASPWDGQAKLCTWYY